MTVPIPTHLAGRVVPIASERDDGRSFALRSSNGGDRFELRYSGRWLPEHGMIVGDVTPLLVVARAIGTGEDLVAFDGGRHGYDAMFADEHDPDVLRSRRADRLLELDGRTAFAVEVHVFDFIDWDLEADDMRDDDGALRLTSGEVIDVERLRADGFSWLCIDVVTPDGVRHRVVDEELS